MGLVVKEFGDRKELSFPCWRADNFFFTAGIRVTRRWTLFDARLRDLDLWPLGQMLRMVTLDNMISHLLVAFACESDSKWRIERVPTVKNDVFSGFWLRDLDLWPLGQMLRMVTQDIVIAHRLVTFAIKSDSKWRNERVPRHSTSLVASSTFKGTNPA